MRGVMAVASCHFGGCMVRGDVPLVTSSQQFLDDLAHVRITMEGTISVDLKKHFSFTQLLVRTAQRTGWYAPWRRATWATEWCWALVPRLWGSRRACGWRQGRREGGAWSGGRPHCARLARGRERRGPHQRSRHAPGDRFRDPDAGGPLVLIVMQDSGVVCPCNGCCFKLS